MYIKIKYLKYFFLTSSIIILATVNYFSAAAEVQNTPNQLVTQKDSPFDSTNLISQNLSVLVSQKNNRPITKTDIEQAVNNAIGDKIGDPITIENLPSIDTEKIKTLKQDYSRLSEKEKQQKEADDARKYVSQMFYLLITNAPQTIASKNDLKAFRQTFDDKLAGLSGSYPDYAYFSDMAGRIDIFVDQAMQIEVPEKLFALHVTFLRIAKGFSSLQTSSLHASSDPIERYIIILKSRDLVSILANFFMNDFKNQMPQITINK